MTGFAQALSPDLTLYGQHVMLEPLSEQHLVGLALAASDGELWTIRVTSVPHPDSLEQWYDDCIAQREAGRQLPFVVRARDTLKVLGATRYYDLEPVHRNLSIGYTWYAASAQRTAVNTEAKLLLLSHAFEQCQCIAVYWHTHHENFRSQKAIERLGARRDGVLRNHKLSADGTPRNTVCYSMIDSEWPLAKAALEQKLSTNVKAT